MKLTLKSALIVTALMLSGTAMAQATPEGSAGNPVPLCSRTVKDGCMNPSQAPHRAMHQTRHNRAKYSHHRHASHSTASHVRKHAPRR